MANKEQADAIKNDIINKATEMLVKRGYSSEESKKTAAYYVDELLLTAERFMLSDSLTTCTDDNERDAIHAKIVKNREASERLNKQYFQKTIQLWQMNKEWL